DCAYFITKSLSLGNHLISNFTHISISVFDKYPSSGHQLPSFISCHFRQYYFTSTLTVFFIQSASLVAATSGSSSILTPAVLAGGSENSTIVLLSSTATASMVATGFFLACMIPFMEG